MTPPQEYFADPQFQALEAVFHDYVAQGEGRNVTWLAAKTGLPLSTVAKGMVKGFWLQRIQAIGKEAAAMTRDRAAVAAGKLIGDVSGMNERDVARLVELEEKAFNKLITRLENDELKDELLVKIVSWAMEKRRSALGLGEGAPPANPLQRLLEGSLGDGTPGQSKPFTLDPKKLESPPDLPKMPGMTSDDVPEDPHRELDDEEKEMLRP